MKKLSKLVVGLVLGLFLGACGVAGAQAINDALTLPYDNATSGLEATNVQDAISELAASSTIQDEYLVGTWVMSPAFPVDNTTGYHYTNRTTGYPFGESFTFYADGTYEIPLENGVMTTGDYIVAAPFVMLMNNPIVETKIMVKNGVTYFFTNNVYCIGEKQ